MEFSMEKLQWTRSPKVFTLEKDRVTITTEPYTDLWQRTYYGFQNDNAPLLQMQTREQYFSFTVRTYFPTDHRYDQCGIVLYLNGDNWLKASVEYENESYQHLGSVVTNLGYSDWATTELDAAQKVMWYRLSRRESDFRIECSADGENFSQMRICHIHDCPEEISFGIYACSPENSSFTAEFTDFSLTECVWKEHV